MRQVSILLVEDNSGDIALFKEAVSESGAEINLEILFNGEEACEQLSKKKETGKLPDVIFLDLNLPRRSGVEVLLELKSNPALRFIPVIVVTSAIVPREIELAYQSGANCVITKPFELKSYLETMSLAIKFWHATVSAQMAPE